MNGEGSNRWMSHPMGDVMFTPGHEVTHSNPLPSQTRRRAPFSSWANEWKLRLMD